MKGTQSVTDLGKQKQTKTGRTTVYYLPCLKYSESAYGSQSDFVFGTAIGSTSDSETPFGSECVTQCAPVYA